MWQLRKLLLSNLATNASQSAQVHICTASYTGRSILQWLSRLLHIHQAVWTTSMPSPWCIDNHSSYSIYNQFQGGKPNHYNPNTLTHSTRLLLSSSDSSDFKIWEVMDQLKPRRCNQPIIRLFRASADTLPPPRAHCTLALSNRCSLASLVIPQTVASLSSSASSASAGNESSVLVNTFSSAVATSSGHTPLSLSSFFRRWGPQSADRHRDRAKLSAYSRSLCNPLPSKRIGYSMQGH